MKAIHGPGLVGVQLERLVKHCTAIKGEGHRTYFQYDIFIMGQINHDVTNMDEILYMLQLFKQFGFLLICTLILNITSES